MRAFDVPGLAIGIVVGDKLVYAKGFGVRAKGGVPVNTQTLFQIGSATKAFLSTTMAIAVDRGKLHWDDRIVDLDPDFQMRDPWVTREFRVFDLMAQRSGLPPYANDFLDFLGLDRSAQIRSLRYVDPVSSFRTTFAYTNITHILAGRIVARAEGAADWNAVLQSEILDPLGMRDTTYSAAAMTASANHALGHRYTVDGSVEVPFQQLLPYDMDGAGDINSNIEDMAKWVSLQLAGGTTPGGQRIVSAENLAYTHTTKVAMSDKASYARSAGSCSRHRTATSSSTMAELLALAQWSPSSLTASSASLSSPTNRMLVCRTRSVCGPSTVYSATQWSTTRRQPLLKPRRHTPTA
jgi:CubicO group peptidase (beta-lactamase class C family)